MTPTAGALEARLATLFPAGVAVAAERIVAARADLLWPEERTAVTGAVPHRLDEFVAGRTAARRTLSALGEPVAPLPTGTDRAAIWPTGIAGSIAHASGFAVAVARKGTPLGVDLEDDGAIAPDLWPILCTPDELRRLPAAEAGQTVKRLFCAKEAVFKAQPAGARALFGHETLSVTLAETTFDAQFLTDAGVFRKGQVVMGRIVVAEGLVLTGVAL